MRHFYFAKSAVPTVPHPEITEGSLVLLPEPHFSLILKAIKHEQQLLSKSENHLVEK